MGISFQSVKKFPKGARHLWETFFWFGAKRGVCGIMKKILSVLEQSKLAGIIRNKVE
jgi:hypothetical protein